MSPALSRPDDQATASPPGQPAIGRYLRGAGWSALNAAASVLLPLGVFVVFARWLPIAEFGVVALAMAVCEMVKAFGLPGLYEALLQQREDRQRCAETALGCLLLSGLLLFCVQLLLAPQLARLVPTVSDAWWVIAVTGCRIPIDLVALQPQAALAERLSFRRLALRSVVATIGAAAVGLGLAMAGHAFVGLVVYQLALSVLLLLTTVLGTKTLARPRLHRDCLRRMLPEAARASAIRLVAASNNYLDQIAVAGLIGGLQLGFYNLAKRVETTFITAGSSFSSILFQPIFAQRTQGGDAAGLRRGLAVLTMTCGLAAAFVAATYPRLIPVIFGPPWTEAAPVAALLALGGFARALGGVHGSLLSVSGRNRQLLWVSSASAIAGLLLVVVLAPIGLVPCAAALAARSTGSTGILAWMTRRDLPRLGRAYALEVGLPFGLMLGSASVATMLAEATVADVAGHPAWPAMLILAAAGLAALGSVTAYFGLRLLYRRQSGQGGIGRSWRDRLVPRRLAVDPK